eukprot:3903317-Rhodomonas_salina.3
MLAALLSASIYGGSAPVYVFSACIYAGGDPVFAGTIYGGSDAVSAQTPSDCSRPVDPNDAVFAAM